MKLAIIGGGASGLFAAANAARINISGRKLYSEIVVYEKSDRVGKKLLVTGNGHCNLANTDTSSEKYYTATPEIVVEILEKHPPAEIIAIFEGLGLLCKTEESGRVYPVCQQASAVLDILRFTCESRGVTTINGAEITYIKKSCGKFIFGGENGAYTADRIIIACGGKASPALGSDGGGLELLRRLGHKITPVFPALTQIKTENSVTKSLKGIKFEQGIKFLYNNEKQAEAKGEVLFTEYGLSGTAAMEISHHVARRGGGEIILDSLPDYSFAEAAEILTRKQRAFPELILEHFLIGIVNKRFGQMVLKLSDFPLKIPAETLSTAEINKITAALKKFTLKATGTTGFKNAQATLGGADLSEFDPLTLESKIIPGLYACGEVLDVCGACGGYNLTWAFASALTAAGC